MASEGSFLDEAELSKKFEDLLRSLKRIFYSDEVVEEKLNRLSELIGAEDADGSDGEGPKQGETCSWATFIRCKHM